MMSNFVQETIIHNPDIKLLVVDDREDNLFSIETILEKDGYSITKATSGRAALKILLKEQDFTLILMDVQMPDINGFETAELIYERDKLKNIPIIFITANDHVEENIFKGYQLGGVDYIYKPINPELLRAKVGVFAELYKKTRALIVQDQKLKAANKKLEEEIEERKQSEKKISQLNRQLVENISQLKIINSELERYAFVASHDLQEPLRKIIIFGDKLKDRHTKAMDSEGIDLLDRMIKSSKKMQLLIKSILELSRAVIEPDKFVETDINVTLNSVLSDLELNIQQKEAQIECKGLPVMKVIPDQFRQLFYNLISNALKFSKSGTPAQISIECTKTKGMYIPVISYDRYEDSFYVIKVTDNGIGFEAAYADKIFLMFKRLHTFDQVEGSGIGLTICKKIVENHQGHIYAEAIPGEGATFTIVLPVNLQVVVRDEVAASNN